MSTDRFKTLPITLHSKRVQHNGVFVAMQGVHDNGVRYINEAISNGAREIIVADTVIFDQSTRELCNNNGVKVTCVENTRKALAERAAELHGHPARQLYCIGITGTKGKTTTAWLTYHLLTQAGYRTALLSTVENKIGDTVYATELTTQQPDYLHAFLRACVDEGVTHVVIEVAAQALSQYRVHGIQFAEVAWLNFSQEHGEFYAREQDYWNAKASLLSQVMPGGTIIVPHDARFQDVIKRHDVLYKTWSCNGIVPGVAEGSQAYVVSRYHNREYRCPHLLGTHNSANLLVALMLAHNAGVGLEALSQGLESFSGVPGRLNWHILPRNIRVCMDYAHNPASFEATLSALRTCTPYLIVIFGAGGQRDAARRPVMGAIAASYSDAVILTTDNPRSEDPAAICRDIMSGILPLVQSKVMIELDREKAIRYACAIAPEHAIIAVLGKGTEEYQLIQGTKHFFSDRAVVESITYT